ncbi:MAG TPA: hypothetical protein VEJ87_16345 [Acidimicrobiales bacterium]|nr:hypothetical protein [Acidimicrobiales bacterium]
MASQVEVVEFTADDATPVVERMRDLANAHRGWVNLQPGIHPDDEPPPPSGLAALFAANAPFFAVPVCTWTPGRMTRRGPAHDSLGIQHGTGPKVVARLASAGLPLKEGWRWTQDHPRRGLVLSLPAGTDPGEVVLWLIEATDILSAIDLTGDWRAEVHA